MMSEDTKSANTVRMFRDELELCGLSAGETVGIYTEASRRRGYAHAFAHAATELGATAFHVDLPEQPPREATDLGGPTGGSGLSAIPSLRESFEGCDLVIDLAFLLFTREQQQILDSGTKMFACVEPLEVLRRLFPTEDQRRRAIDGKALIAEAKTFRLTNEGGTDLLYEFGDYHAACQYGYSDEPGHWDHFATTLVTNLPNDGAVEGTLVLQPGDTVFPFGRYVAEPVRMEIADGAVKSIDGGVDAMFIRDYMASFDDERGYAVAHIGWGLNENARWDALTLSPDSMGTDARSYHGSVMFSTGPNTHHGGDNNTLCHVDIPMRDCSAHLDGELIIDRGRVLEPSQQALTDRVAGG
jgi:2,5-dihydroxypyridine 5,6-dioxygenase